MDTEYNKQTGADVAQWFTGRIRHSWTQSTINTGAGVAQWFTGRIRHSWTQSTINTGAGVAQWFTELVDAFVQISPCH